jgi:hypothetical protein
VMAAACIIPGKDIVVIVDNCGEEWLASTPNASGYNGLGEEKDIQTVDEHWVARTYCLTPAQGDQLEDWDSTLYADVLTGIIAECKARAVELGLGGNNCYDVATIVYVGTCTNSGGCEDEGAGEETAATETGDNPNFGDLDLTQEVTLVRDHYVISQLLIDTVLADPVGVGNDGTTAAQVRDTTGNPYGFEISGTTSTNLGGVLGLQNGDVITAVSNQPTKTYDDLLDVAAILLSARTATVELTRGTASVTLIYQRGT